MYEISSEAYFSAAHHLRDYNGPCENVHGHNWYVRAYVRCDKVNELGIGIDFKKLKMSLKEVIDKLDHCDLNTIFNKESQNPSSENIAQYIYKQLEPKVNDSNCSISRVDVYETPGNCASYFEHA